MLRDAHLHMIATTFPLGFHTSQTIPPRLLSGQGFTRQVYLQPLAMNVFPQACCKAISGHFRL